MGRPSWKWWQARSVKIGDIGHIVYKGTYGRDAFRLCKVVSVNPNVYGVVRTNKVEFRSRKRNKTGAKYKPRNNLRMKIGKKFRFLPSCFK